MKRLQLLMARINRASLRERALLFAAAIAVMSFAWSQLVMKTLEAKKTAIANTIETMRVNASVNAAGHTDDLVAERYAELKSRDLALTKAIAEADAQLSDMQRGMIEPKEMVKVLTAVLERQTNLHLVLLRNLPVQPLLKPAEKSDKADPADKSAKAVEDAADDAGPYLHPVELVVRGDYLNVLAYLKELEAENWGFQWRRFELVASEEGPEYHIQFMTLSMESNWLGV
jgi:MSHA biogenesis protein MshJ